MTASYIARHRHERPQLIELIESSRGSIPAIAATLGYTEATIRQRIRKDPALREAYQRIVTVWRARCVIDNVVCYLAAKYDPDSRQFIAHPPGGAVQVDYWQNHIVSRFSEEAEDMASERYGYATFGWIPLGACPDGWTTIQPRRKKVQTRACAGCGKPSTLRLCHDCDAERSRQTRQDNIKRNLRLGHRTHLQKICAGCAQKKSGDCFRFAPHTKSGLADNCDTCEQRQGRRGLRRRRSRKYIDLDRAPS